MPLRVSSLITEIRGNLRGAPPPSQTHPQNQRKTPNLRDNQCF